MPAALRDMSHGLIDEAGEEVRELEDPIWLHCVLPFICWIRELATIIIAISPCIYSEREKGAGRQRHDAISFRIKGKYMLKPTGLYLYLRSRETGLSQLRVR